MSLLLWIVLFCLLGGVLSVLAASLFLLTPERARVRAMPHMISFAIGALLGAAFLALLPHALEPRDIDPHSLMGVVLGGLLCFFLLEKMVLWRHCHSTTCDVHGAEDAEHHHAHQPNISAGTMVLIGDSLHNFIDGILIAAAFLHDTELGVVTALAVAAHEIPQEVGDFAVLLHSGFSRTRAFVFNLLTSVTTVIGGVLAYFSLSGVGEVVPYVLAVAASSFIYVAVADLIPGLHRATRLHETVKQFVLIAMGILVIGLAHSTLH